MPCLGVTSALGDVGVDRKHSIGHHQNYNPLSEIRIMAVVFPQRDGIVYSNADPVMAEVRA